MKRIIAVFLIMLIVFSGCADNSRETEATMDTSKYVEVTVAPSVPFDATISGDIITPGEMPSPGEGDAEIPPQPQPTIHDK